MIATPEEQELIDQLPIGCTVEHYKGKRMQVLTIARHTEDHTLYVVYQKLYNCERFGDRAVVVRPLKMFLETVVVNGVEQPRFRVVEDLAVV